MICLKAGEVIPLPASRTPLARPPPEPQDEECHATHVPLLDSARCLHPIMSFFTKAEDGGEVIKRSGTGLESTGVALGQTSALHRLRGANKRASTVVEEAQHVPRSPARTQEQAIQCY